MNEKHIYGIIIFNNGGVCVGRKTTSNNYPYEIVASDEIFKEEEVKKFIPIPSLNLKYVECGGKLED